METLLNTQTHSRHHVTHVDLPTHTTQPAESVAAIRARLLDLLPGTGYDNLRIEEAADGSTSYRATLTAKDAHHHCLLGFSDEVATATELESTLALKMKWLSVEAYANI